MELSNLWFCLLFLIPFLWLCLHKRKAENVRVPPGSSGLPLIGETLSFYLKLRKGAHLDFITERIQKYSSNIFRTSLMGEQVVFISGAEGNRFIFSNEDKLVQAWIPSRVDKIFPMSDDSPVRVWHRKCLRQALSPWILNTDGIRGFLDLLDVMTRQHVEACWTPKGDADQVIITVAEVSKRCALAFQCKVFLGMDDQAKAEQLVDGINAIEAAFVSPAINLPGTTWSRGVKASKVMRSRIEAVVRANKPEKGLIADMLLIKYENGETMPVEDVACLLLGLLEAGYLTVQITITMLFKTLSEHPRVYDSVLREQEGIARSKKAGEGIEWGDFKKMKYTWNVVREVLRLHSPTPLSFREVIADFTYQGYTIPKGWKMLWLPQSTHKDPKYFPNPEKFDPSRFDGEGPSPNTYVPFAAGLSMCPGYKLAKIQILTFLHYAVINYRWEKVNPNERLLQSLVPHLAQGLPVRLYRHKNKHN